MRYKFDKFHLNYTLYFVKLFFDLFHIRKHIVLFSGVAQKESGVVDGGDEHTVFFCPFAVLLGDLLIGAYKLRGGYPAEADDHLRLKKLYLSAQKAYASCLLGGAGVAILRGTAFQDVCDINAVP